MTSKEKYHNPWRTRSTSVKYQNPWIKVREDQVINPAGNEGIYGVVEFKSCAVGILPVDDQLGTWLVGQWRYSLEAYSWEIPMGGVPFDEDLLAGAARELKEETGLMAQKLEKILDLHTSNSVTDESGVVILATGLTQGDAEPEETEDICVKYMSLAESVEWVLQGRITDAISVAGILAAARIYKL